MPSIVRLALLLFGVLQAGVLVHSGGPAQWPGWGGPDRDFTTDAAGLATSWPAAGPPTLWSRPLGEGHSSIVVDGRRLYTMYRPPTGRSGTWAEEEVVIALDAQTGRTIWEHRFPSSLETMNFNYGAGPHATPLVVGDRLFAASSDKQFFALDKHTGMELWSHHFVEDFGATPNQMRFAVMPGYAPSPIAYGETVIAMVGAPHRAVMAFDQSTGDVVWSGGDFPDSIVPASPVLITVDGQEQLIAMSGDAVQGMDPTDGRVLWRHTFPTDMGVNLTTPVWSPDDQRLFLTASLDGGTRALQLQRAGDTTTVTELWFTNRMRVHHSNIVQFGDYYYGSSGDPGPSFLTAIDGRTGEVVWQARDFPKSNFLKVGERVILLDEDGRLALARFTPDQATVISEAVVTTTPSWTAPTLADGRLYIRDHANIMALDVTGP